jgi:hypothetical protein
VKKPKVSFIWREILEEKKNSLLQLNIDERRPHHFIIGVAQYELRSSKRGQIYLKYGPLRFTNADVKRLQDASLLSRDEVFRTTNEEAIKIHGVEEFVSTFSAMQLSAAVNQCTLHHFSSEHDIDDEWFEEFVKLANENKEAEELLFNAIINYKPFLGRE